MMNRSNLKLVSNQPAEAVLALRQAEAHDAWLALCAAPLLLQSYLAWVAALDRVDAERARIWRESAVSRVRK